MLYKISVLLFLLSRFIQEQPTEPGRHGNRTVHRCLPTSSPHPDLYGATNLRSDWTDMGRLLNQCPNRRLLLACETAHACPLEESHLSQQLLVQHPRTQGSQIGCPGGSFLIDQLQLTLIFHQTKRWQGEVNHTCLISLSQLKTLPVLTSSRLLPCPLCS